MKNILLAFVTMVLLANISCITQPQRTYSKKEIKHEERDVVCKEIRLADSKQHEIIGYLEESTIVFSGNPTPKKICYIMDASLRLSGFFMENGSTYQYDFKGNPVKKGEFTLENAIRNILGFQGAFYFQNFESELFIDR
ncbi:MAG: hypothetical protein HY811_02395 [Planctomycetes bacterium]|nr:hypothetical protein [Planctomycetota bacterium]